MAQEAGKSQLAPADAQLFGLLCHLLHDVESLNNREEVELRAKIESQGLEVTKFPSKSTQHLSEMEIAKELDILSARLDEVDESISLSMAEDPQVKKLLSDTTDFWTPATTTATTSDERRNFTTLAKEESHAVNMKSSHHGVLSI